MLRCSSFPIISYLPYVFPVYLCNRACLQTAVIIPGRFAARQHFRDVSPLDTRASETVCQKICREMSELDPHYIPSPGAKNNISEDKPLQDLFNPFSSSFPSHTKLVGSSCFELQKRKRAKPVMRKSVSMVNRSHEVTPAMFCQEVVEKLQIESNGR